MVWMALPAPPGAAAGYPIPSALGVAESVFAQANPAAGRDRQEVEQLLREARQAMSRSDWDSAERAIARAEGLPFQVDPLYERFQDTPAKARRTLRELRAARGPDERSLPSERFSPTSTPGGAASTTANLSPPGAATDPRTAGSATLDALTDDAKAKAVALTQKGRMALQQGDATGALGWYQKAAGLNASFAAGEYSPAALADDLRRAGVPAERLIVARPEGGGRPAAHPDDFVSDANSPLPAGLAAGGDGLNSSVFRNSLLERPQDVTAAPYEAMPGAARGEPRRLPTATAAHPAARDEALRLLAMARAALDRGDTAGALQLAEHAQSLGVPDEAFAAGQPRPGHVLMEIQSVLNRRGAASLPSSGVVQAYDPGPDSREPYPTRQSLYDPARTARARSLLKHSPYRTI
jgi:hypothetical protein